MVDLCCLPSRCLVLVRKQGKKEAVQVTLSRVCK